MTFFSQTESDCGGHDESPLSCKFKCGRDVPANLNVRRRTDGDIHNMGRAKPASGRGDEP